MLATQAVPYNRKCIKSTPRLLYCKCMKHTNISLFLKLTSAFLLNLSAAWFLAIYISPSFQEKVNDIFTCIVCFGAAYYFEQQVEA